MMNEFAPQLHVLVADDNDVDRLWVSQILAEEGCRVTEADNGLQAVELYEQLHPDLIWLDVLMPLMTGLDVCERIGPHAERHQVPILIVTALNDTATVERAFEAGASDYLTKPFTASILRKRLRRLLHMRRVEKAIQRAKREWETMSDIVPDLILLTDSQGRIVRCNQAAIRRFETSYAAILGTSLTGLFYGDTVPQPGIFAVDSIAAQFPHLPGWYQVSNYPVQSDSGDTRLGYAHVMRDITLERQMADRLYANEQKFRALVENTSEGIQLIDATGQLLYASPHIVQMLGYELDFVGESAFKHIHPDDLAYSLESFNQLLQQPGGSVSTELRVRHNDGQWLWLHLTGRNLLNVTGVEAILVNLRDVTERRLADEQLRASEARYRTLFEDSPVALWEEDFSAVKSYLDQLWVAEKITDFQAYLESHPQVVIDCASVVKVIAVNKSAMQMLGAVKKEELFNSLASILALDGYKGFRGELLAISQGRTRITVENINRSINAEPRFVSIIWSVWPGYEATLSRVTVSIMDLTEWRQSEEALRVSRKRYELAVLGSNDGIWDWDFTNNKVYISSRYKGILGYSDDEIQASLATFFELLHPEDVACVKSAIREYLAGSSATYDPEFRMRHKDGSYRWVLARGVALRDTDGNPYRMAGSVTDITERKQAEDKLRVVTQAIEQSSTAIIITDVHGNIEYVNPYFTQLTGYKLDEVQGKNPRLLKSGESPLEVYQQLWATITAGKEWRGEFHNKKKNGEFYWAQASISPIVNSFGTITRFLAVQEDITERKQAEAHLRVSEERFKLVTYATNDAVWELDLATRQRWWNTGVRSVFGYVPEQVGVDQTWWEALVHPDDRAKVLASLETAISGDGQFWSKEYRYCRADGSYAYVFDRGYVIQDNQGRPQRIIGAMMDITERKRTEDALRQSEETFSKAFHASPLPMAIVSVQRTIYTDMNSGWEALFNLKRENTIGQALLVSKPRIKAESTDSLLKLLREQGYVRDFEIVYQPDTQDERVLLVSAQTVDIRSKASYLFTCYDITEQRRMHTAMAASQKLADLGTLAAGVAHEMNSPLQVITGVSQSLLRRLSTGSLQMDNLKRNLEVVHRNGWRCAEIVRSLHTYARASGGAPDPADLNDLVRDTLLLIEHQLKSWANIAVLTNLTPDLPPLTCDHNQITQVLINLLTNARDAMPEGGEISIQTRYDAQTNQLILRVQDSGAGIPDSIRDRIFDPFFTTKSLGKGTGLGLSIVAGIVRAHGGVIDIESTSHKGTLFTLRFPVQLIRLPPAENDNTRGRFDTLVEVAAAPQGVSQ